ARGASSETAMVVDWSAFENTEECLDSVPVSWEERQPRVFVKSSPDGFETGTRIVISQVNRWTPEMMLRLARGINVIMSPLSGLRDFQPELVIEDPLSPPIRKDDVFELLQNVPYTFSAEVDSDGKVSYQYTFKREDYPEINRVV